MSVEFASEVELANSREWMPFSEFRRHLDEAEVPQLSLNLYPLLEKGVSSSDLRKRPNAIRPSLIRRSAAEQLIRQLISSMAVSH